jgi:hypothetical protein
MAASVGLLQATVTNPDGQNRPAEYFITASAKYIYESPVLEDRERIVSDALDVSLAGFARITGTSTDVRYALMKVAG